jgi:hypothetical protein
MQCISGVYRIPDKNELKNKIKFIIYFKMDSVTRFFTNSFFRQLYPSVPLMHELKQRIRYQSLCILYIKSVREPVGWGRETNFIWFGTSVQTMEHIFLPRELTVYNS